MNARESFVLGEWTVDPATGTLTGPAGQRHLTPKLTDLLVALARRAGHVATRDELLRDVWGERSAVSDEPLTRAVAELRKILGDVRADPAYIETIPKRGYRVIAAVRPALGARSERDVRSSPESSAEAAPPAAAASQTLHPWAGAVPLAPGQWAGTTPARSEPAPAAARSRSRMAVLARRRRRRGGGARYRARAARSEAHRARWRRERRGPAFQRSQPSGGSTVFRGRRARGDHRAARRDLRAARRVAVVGRLLSRRGQARARRRARARRERRDARHRALRRRARARDHAAHGRRYRQRAVGRHLRSRAHGRGSIRHAVGHRGRCRRRLEAFARGRRRERRADADGELARLRGVLARQVSLPPQATG